jgi:hypothetical protein
MRVNWILQTDIFSENLDKLTSEITKQGHKYFYTKYTPFTNKQDIPETDGPTIFYGSLNYVNSIKKTQLIPGVWCDLDKLKCSYYYNYLGKFLLNSPYTFISAGEFTRMRAYLEEQFGENGYLFVRPDSGFKTICGGVIEPTESLETYACNQVVFPEEFLVVARPLKISREWRVIICGGKAITGSLYKVGKGLEFGLVPDEVMSYAQEVADTWCPERCWVCDICESNGLHLLEINSFSCSGFYGSDMAKVVEAASKETFQEFASYE